MTFQNPPPGKIRALLERVRRIAVVGLSPNPARPSHGVARALQGFGYKIIPVRPAVEEVLGEKAYPDLKHLPGPVDLVDVFRAPQHVDAIMEDCIALRALWKGSARRQGRDALHGNQSRSGPVSGARQRPRSLPKQFEKSQDDLFQYDFGPPAIWLQEGVVNEAAAERARQVGLFVVMDRCIYKDYRALIGG